MDQVGTDCETNRFGAFGGEMLHMAMLVKALKLQALTLQLRTRSMPERRKWSVAYAAMDLSKALRM